MVLGKVVPDSFRLKVIKDVGEPALKSFYLMVEGLLKIEERARGVAGTGTAKGADPNVGGVEIL